MTTALQCTTMPTKCILYVSQILEWADTYHKYSGKWPTVLSGRIVGAGDTTWGGIDSALTRGLRGLPGGWSLARLLTEYRGKRYHLALPPFTIEQILQWADAFHKSAGAWPIATSGPVAGASDTTWMAIDQALVHGARGLPGGSSLAKLLAEHRGKRNASDLQPLTIKQVLAWADAYFERTGKWPSATSGAIPDSNEETWVRVAESLQDGRRGFKNKSSLACFLAEHRGKRNHMARPRISIEQILEWADKHFRRTRNWPTRNSGPIPGADHDTWAIVDNALQSGIRGLEGGSSLARLLAEYRGKRNPMALPPLKIEQILAWADVHHCQTGDWPSRDSGQVAGTDTTWSAVDNALRSGSRGLPGGSSLIRLLAATRGVQNPADLPRLTEKAILAWADAYFQRTGKWPASHSGPIMGSRGETWAKVDQGLRSGLRGLRGGSSLSQLLERRRRKLRKSTMPVLSIEQILEWADAYHAQTGNWPNAASGPIDGTSENWRMVNKSLNLGHRGLPGGASLLRLLKKRRGAAHARTRPQLTLKMILDGADAHHERTGNWPLKSTPGEIPESPGDNWLMIDAALIRGGRGLKGKSSLYKVLLRYRGVKRHVRQSPLSLDQIRTWAETYRQRTGRWPIVDSGPIPESPGDTWLGINGALKDGRRGIVQRTSLTELFPKPPYMPARPLTEAQILAWADAYIKRHGHWPMKRSGAIPGVPGETWYKVNSALYFGIRGLPGGSSLYRLLQQNRPAT